MDEIASCSQPARSEFNTLFRERNRLRPTPQSLIGAGSMIQRQRICVGDRIAFQRFENLQAGGFEAGIAEQICKHAGPFDAVGLPPSAFEGFQQSNAFSVHLADEEGSGIVQAGQKIIGMIPVSQSRPGQGTLMTTASPCQFHLEQKIVGRNHRGTPPECFR